MSNKILSGISVLIILLLIGFGFFMQQEDETVDTDLVEYEDTGIYLDTVNTIRVYAASEEEGKTAVDQVFERLQEIDRKLSIYDEDSEISAVNQQAGKESVEVSRKTYEILEDSIHYARELEGSFDPSIGALTLLWGWGSEEGPSVPDEEEVRETLDFVDYNKIEMQENNNQVSLAEEGMRLDLGAIAKGYASVEARQVLKDNNIDSAFVNLGGNITLMGMKPDETPWRIGIQHPRSDRGEVMAAVDVDEEELETSEAVVTSGDYERYFEEDGEEYHHIIDPETGYPTVHEIISTTIVTDDPIKADAYSTGVLVRGMDGLEFVEETENMEAVFISENLDVFATSGVRDRLELFDEEFEMVDMEEI
ncbi:FAD:protein FMN transferase [Halarsenatibacter silvermanii]|uniref:FAD:protein FMN transferase n=1 Tax=Halarsenatibacter silvermanii TaxID=321763 RepID=A0A1G9NKI6_9FIRM|nr:FAD:protein FMN transferase [Halarsenatibacter silvermanii]SDL86823.1 thiamine biosynthesis lipoprotein [Halarsenatibacter silvermanii]